MTEYYIPTGPGEAEFTEKRSRFLGHVRRVESEEEAKAFIAEMKKKYYDARHNCWCYIIRDGAERYSDDGEPQGTAGIPMLEVFRREGLCNVVCVVTRYFGGVLLGAGGLLRAPHAIVCHTENASVPVHSPSVNDQHHRFLPPPAGGFPCQFPVRLHMYRVTGHPADVSAGLDGRPRLCRGTVVQSLRRRAVGQFRLHPRDGMALAGLDAAFILVEAVAALVVLRHDALQPLHGQPCVVQKLRHGHPAMAVHVQSGCLRVMAQQKAQINGDLPVTLCLFQAKRLFPFSAFIIMHTEQSRRPPGS